MIAAAALGVGTHVSSVILPVSRCPIRSQRCSGKYGRSAPALHYIDFAGEFFSVRGPSITLRSPQAHPPVVVRADEPEALPVLARWAQVARIAAPDLSSAAAARARVREAVAAAGRDPDEVAVLLDVETLLADTADQAHRTLEQLDGWAGAERFALRTYTQQAPTAALVGTPAGLADLVEEAVRGGAADGVTLVPLALPTGLRLIADALVPLLVERDLRSASGGGPLRMSTQSKAVPGGVPLRMSTQSKAVPGGVARARPATLRDRLGLPRPANHFTEARA